MLTCTICRSTDTRSVHYIIDLLMITAGCVSVRAVSCHRLNLNQSHDHSIARHCLTGCQDTLSVRTREGEGGRGGRGGREGGREREGREGGREGEREGRVDKEERQ